MSIPISEDLPRLEFVFWDSLLVRQEFPATSRVLSGEAVVHVRVGRVFLSLMLCRGACGLRRGHRAQSATACA